MHNNIMAAGSRDRPSMLAIGRYAQWRSHFLRYIDTRPNGDALKMCILEVPERTTVETTLNMSPENKAHFESENEAIHLILTGIGDEIYSTVDACKTAHEIWEAIERLQQGESLNIQDTEFERYKAFNDRTVDYAKLEFIKEKHDELVKPSLLTKSHYEGLVKEKTKTYLCQSNVPKKAQSEKPCLYEILNDQSNPANKLVPDREETLTLERESRSKLNKDLVRPYDYTKLNSLYEMFKPTTQEYQIQLADEIRKKIWRKSFVKTKPNIFKNIDFLPVSKSISKSRQAYNVMTNKIGHFREIVDQAWVKHSKDHFRAPTAHDMEIPIKICLMPLALKTHNDSFVFVHELKQEMHADLKYAESLKKEIDKVESDKAEFSNMYDMLLQECVSNDVMCSYLYSLSDFDAHTELQCLYLHKVKECDCLAQKLLKQTESAKQMKNDTVCKEKTSNVFRKEREQYFETQDLKAQLQDKNISICELKKLIEKCKGKSMETKFDKPSVVRQPNAQRIPKPSVLGKPTLFSDSLERKHFSKTKSVPETNVSEGLSKPVTTQNLPQTARQDIIQLILFIVDSGCTKHMAGNLKMLCNFVEKYLAIETACYTQNRSIFIPAHEKMEYHIINDRKPPINHLHIFGCTCYLTRDGENLDNMKEKGDLCILVGYSTQSKGYIVYNKRTRLIVESIHLRFYEIKEISETSVANDTSGLVPQRQKASDYDNFCNAPLRKEDVMS
nr:hypothetical protein [Tanacetum cinerariifolium]